jgi:hypothetical protein
MLLLLILLCQMRYSIARGSGGSKKIGRFAIAISNYQCFNVTSISSGNNFGASIGTSTFADNEFHLFYTSDYGINALYNLTPKLIISGGLLNYKLRQEYHSLANTGRLDVKSSSYGANVNIQKELLSISAKTIKLYGKFGINCILDPRIFSRTFSTELPTSDTTKHYFVHRLNYNSMAGVNFLYQLGVGARKSLTNRIAVSAFVESVNGLRNLTTDLVLFVTDYYKPQPHSGVWANFTGQNRGDKVGLGFSLEIKL